ncbi:MAG: hypothetical protein WBO09_23120 [Methylocystis silviterrae]|uniref:hypothetical protein n=1 Tax=Methylocystis silviterrae TaxID=2743612 RepID=UPI003C70CB95
MRRHSLKSTLPTLHATRSQRQRDAIEIPGLSPSAKETIERLREAGCEARVSSSIGRQALHEKPIAARASAIWSTTGVKTRDELARFAAAVDARFPEEGARPAAPAAIKALAARRIMRNAVLLHDVHQAHAAHERKTAAQMRRAFPEPAPDPAPRPWRGPSPGF